MLRIERILCPTDFSQFSAKAFDYAQSLAQHYKASLSLVHVSQPPVFAYPTYPYTDVVDSMYRDIREHAEQQLQAFVRGHAHDSIQVECSVTEGGVTDAVLCFAEKRGVDLIVMGTHGRQGLDRLLLGSVTEKILRKARCPVLVVGRTEHDFVSPGKTPDPVKLGKILWCTDFSEHSVRALEYALSLALEYGAELTLLHVLEEVPSAADLQSLTSEIVARLEKPIPDEMRRSGKIKPRVRIGRPYQEILELTLKEKFDLIILGVRGRNALDLALFGSTTHRVIQLGACPVLAVHI